MKTSTKSTKPRGVIVKVAVGNESVNKTVNGQVMTVTGGEKVSSRVSIKASKGAKRNPASSIAIKPKAKKELTAREATMLAWQTSYANRHKRMA